MNHIYRRIWSTAKNCWVLGSELAVSRGKRGGATIDRRRAFVAVLGLLGAGINNAYADLYMGCDPFSPRDVPYCSPHAGQFDEKVFTYYAYTTARNALAMGAGSRVNADNSFAFGHGTRIDGQNSAAFGFKASVYGVDSIAIGYNARTSADGGHNVAIGANAYAAYIGATALGNKSEALAENAVTIGSGASSRVANSVALGANSKATEADTVSVGTAASRRRIVNVADARLNATSTDAVTGKQLYATEQKITALNGMVKAGGHSDSFVIGTGSVSASANSVSVGSASNKRRLQYLADGTVIAGSTDAITGNQLHATNTKVTAATTTADAAKKTADAMAARVDAAAPAIGYTALAEGTGGSASAAVGRAAKAYNTNSVAFGADARAGVDESGEKSAATGAVAVGASSRSGNGAVASGLRASALGDRAVAMGNDASASATHAAAVGYRASASGNQSAAVGRQASASGLFSTAIGNLANAEAESATALGDRAVASHAGSVALGNGSQTTAANQISVGSATVKRKLVNLADGALSTSSTEAVTGRQLNATNTNVTAARSVADSAKTNADNALAKANTLSGLLSQASASGNVRLGASNSGTVLDVRNSASANRKITGVADATLSTTSTDAVSGKQLNSTNSNVTAARSVADSAKTNADSALAKANTLSGLLSETSVSGNVRLGASNSGTVLDVRNSASANRRITGVADATLSSTSTDAVTGRQLNTTNSNVSTAMSDASSAKTAANTALTQVGTLNGLLNQVSGSGNVRVGEKNSGSVLDVRNSANANRKLTGVADGVVSTSSDEAVNGRQLNATNDRVTTVEGVARSAGADAAVAKTDAAKALSETAALGRLVAQVSASGDVRLGEKNSGTTLDVRNSAGGDRKVRGVSDGALSMSSSDAINGKQLYAVSEVANGAERSAQEAIDRIDSIADQSKFSYVGGGGPDKGAKAGLVAVAIGDSAEASTTSEGAVAVGSFASALAKNSVSLGRAAHVDAAAENGFALGVFSSVKADSGVAIGAGSSVENSASNSAAIGAGSVADEAHVASFGAGSLQRRLVNVARGTADHNAVTVSQLKDSLATLGGGVGMDASGNIIAPTYAVQGGTQNTVEDALMALDGAVITAGRRADKVEDQLSSIFQHSPSARADGMNQIALNGANGMVLTNLADGRVAPGSRDAVTGSQLYAAEQKISQNRNDLEAMRKEREMGEQAMRGLDVSVIDYGGARLTGVADGSVSADSHDVVTGRQLFGVSDRVSKIEDQGRFLKINTDELSKDAFAGFLGVAIGDSAYTGTDGGTALGAYATALGVSSVALGRGSAVSADAPHGFAVGAGSQVHSARGIAIGLGSVVESGAAGSLALGAGSAATEVGVASFGNPNAQRRLVNIANGTANHNAATVGQLRVALSALGSEVDTNGNIVGPSFNVQGQSQSTLNGALEALDGAVVSTTSRVNQVESQLRSVFQETPSVRADGTHQLTLAGANGMVISNVANGLIAAGSRDAVNGGQLHSMQQQLNGRMDGLEQRIDDQPQARAMAAASTPSPSTEETAPAPETSGSSQIASTGEGDKPAPQPKSKQDDTPKPQVDTAELEKMLARANEYTDGAISNFERRLDKMDKRFNRMAAMSSAQTAMAMNTAGLATYNRLGAGVGYSEGESAMAVGYQRVLNEKGSATFSLNGAFTNSGERSMGVGVGIGW
ncbi:ESPR-type extended signal peptide-containing protein [Stenotrophomonas maltophilia]|uniref:ESPR-type extended signal peptide-containing protein n=1 Tax=Stenotrophomonas maltophilia TaxID=40324 RepID=UPI0011309A44|nr:ESPR-type extended signal peptide-containing protein [Stenotrophomonas maltophilia]